MIKNRFFKNTSWILLGHILKLLISFFIGIVSARYLGPNNNGVLNYVSSYISFFTAIIGLGLNGIIVYELVNHREEEGEILGTAIFLRFFVGVVSVFAFLGIVLATDGADKTILTVSFLQAIQLPFLCLDTINFWFQSKMQSKYSVIAQTIAYLVMAAYKVFLLVAGKSVIWFAFAVSLDVVVLGALYFAFYYKYKVQKISWSFPAAKRILKSCVPFILANLMVVIYGHVDRIMIKQLMDSTTQVGLYSAAINICGMISFIPIALLDSARPLIVEAKNESQEKYRIRFKQLVAGIIWACVFYSLFVTIFSGQILHLLYGKEYMGANMCLKIGVWYTSFSYLGSARSFWLICEDKKKYVFIFSALGALCNVLMNYLFIPIWGINGAAIATLMTQFLANFMIPFIFPQTRDYGKSVVEAVFLREVDLESVVQIFFAKLKLFQKK